MDYGTRTHHSNMDVADHISKADLMQASAIMATFVYNTAMRDEMLPRKPLPKPQPKRSEQTIVSIARRWSRIAAEVSASPAVLGAGPAALGRWGRSRGPRGTGREVRRRRVARDLDGGGAGQHRMLQEFAVVRVCELDVGSGHLHFSWVSWR